MPDNVWGMLGVVLPVLIVQVFQFLSQRKSARKAEAGREEIKAQVCEVIDRIDTVRMEKEQIEMLMKGCERQHVELGMEIERRRSTAPAPLGGHQ